MQRPLVVSVRLTRATAFLFFSEKFIELHDSQITSVNLRETLRPVVVFVGSPKRSSLGISAHLGFRTRWREMEWSSSVCYQKPKAGKKEAADARSGGEGQKLGGREHQGGNGTLCPGCPPPLGLAGVFSNAARLALFTISPLNICKGVYQQK